MDYEKKYKEALSLARKMQENSNGTILNESITITDVFPELKESEESADEKIRKALIRFHKSTIDIDGIKGADILAWLEKQGEHANFRNKIQIGDKVTRNEDGVLVNLSQMNRAVEEYNIRRIGSKHAEGKLAEKIKELNDMLEKQGEQKPVLDFKANNWYVSKVDGKIPDMTYNPADKAEPKFKVKYAGSEYNVFETKDIAGVPFYGIEDELNHIDYVQADNCEIISGYAIKENGSSYPTNPAVFSEQKPFDYEKATITQKDFAPKPTEWSDEDEEMLGSIIIDVDYIGEFPDYPTKLDCELKDESNAKIKWLKSIKDRVQPQPKEWSEEDENMLVKIIEEGYLIPSERQWLKSLKNRVQH